MNGNSTTLNAQGLEAHRASAPTGRPARLSLPDLLARRMVERALRDVQHGSLTVVDAQGTRVYDSGNPGPQATVLVRHPSLFRRVLFGGTVGAGEAYRDGLYSSPDLPALMRFFVANRATMERMEGGLARVQGWLGRGLHALRRNTRAGSRRNIAAHYDLGNDFYALWLDPTLSYSACIFPEDGTCLEDAAVAKLERVCRKLALTPQDHLLEIGTGWGGLAIHAARHHGCRVTTTTISRAQHEETTRRVQAAGLSDRVTVLLQDYRELQGRFDKVVSIEMIEAVGHRYLPLFFRRCAELMRPDGLLLVQAITIAEQHHAQALRSVDFIQRHIFPGGSLPSLSALSQAAAEGGALRVAHLEEIGQHYARTLRAWRTRFLAKREAVRAQGYSESLIRMWEFYLAYCEGGFAEESTGTAQLLFTRQGGAVAPLPAWN